MVEERQISSNIRHILISFASFRYFLSFMCSFNKNLPFLGRHQSSKYPDNGEEWQERTVFVIFFIKLFVWADFYNIYIAIIMRKMCGTWLDNLRWKALLIKVNLSELSRMLKLIVGSNLFFKFYDPISSTIDFKEDLWVQYKKCQLINFEVKYNVISIIC